MTPPDWPDLWTLIRPRLQLKGRGQPDREGWVWAHCINPARHKNGDQHPRLRINMRTGGVKWMSQGCDVGTNMNDLAERLGVETRTDSRRIGTIADLAMARRLDGNALIEVWGVSCTAKGWQLTIDDPDAAGFRRLKRYPWANGPKYLWEPRGVKASDLVYGISRLDADEEDTFIACGEPDTWVCVAAGLSAVSFLAGENSVPSAKAIAKLKARAPNLKTVHIAPDLDDAGLRGAHKLGAALLAAGLAIELIHLPDDLPEGGDLTDLWVSCNGDREAFLRRLYGCEAEWLKAEGSRIERRSDDAYTIWLPTEGG